jgi:subtilisin family serine protease
VNLNIPAARTKVTNNKEVIVAIIDDWILINHPDLSSNIYVNNDEKPWDGIDNDQNGFIDDINWYDFLANISTIVPNNTHWTAVAGIIWAITNNYEWIAWIAKNVSLMPVIACDDEWCNEEAIIKSIQYAVDNWADIINLSLSSQWFSYSTKFDDIINYAYEKWVIVVVAWGNGDYWQLEKNWTDTDITKVSPVCNYWNNPKKIIGVWAMNSDGYIARWSNFWECIPFYTYWEGILTTVRNISNDWLHDYDYLDGTSFAAPIIAWVIALWFNQYGHVSPDLVYDALEMSPKYIALHWWEKNWTIDADLYIINLGVLLSQQSSAEANKKAVMPIFKKIKNIISKTPQEKQKWQYLSVIALLENANIPLEKRWMVDSLIKLLLTEV